MALARPVVGQFLLKRIGKRLEETFDVRAVTSDSFLPHAHHVGRIRRTGSGGRNGRLLGDRKRHGADGVGFVEFLPRTFEVQFEQIFSHFPAAFRFEDFKVS